MLHFNMRVVPRGHSYGLSGSLTAEASMVEFYDARFPHTELGQFVSRYYVETFMGHHGALVLDGGVPEWTMTADQVEAAQRTLADMKARGLFK
jgi:hypothetical protein